MGKRNSLITSHALFAQPGSDEEKRRDAYRVLFGAHPNCIAKIRGATNGNYALRNDRFVVEIGLSAKAARGSEERWQATEGGCRELSVVCPLITFTA